MFQLWQMLSVFIFHLIMISDSGCLVQTELFNSEKRPKFLYITPEPKMSNRWLTTTAL